MPIRDLAEHSARYVTIAELAEYWSVSRQQVYKRIESGALDAIKLGRLIRVRTSAALQDQRRATCTPSSRSSTEARHASENDRLSSCGEEVLHGLAAESFSVVSGIRCVAEPLVDPEPFARCWPVASGHPPSARPSYAPLVQSPQPTISHLALAMNVWLCE